MISRSGILCLQNHMVLLGQSCALFETSTLHCLDFASPLSQAQRNGNQFCNRYSISSAYSCYVPQRSLHNVYMELQRASCASTSSYLGVWYSCSSCVLLHHSRDIPKQRNSRTHHLSDMYVFNCFAKHTKICHLSYRPKILGRP